MIPKILHYIWFGGKPLTPLAEQCLASWKEHMPETANGGEWEYMRWDEASLAQVLCEPNLNPSLKGRTSKQLSEQSQEGHSWLDYMPIYVRQAYEARKFAFVSDYVRLWALEQYGGVYVDTDVKVLKSYEPLLGDTAFIGLEESLAHLPGTCVMGCEPHCQWVKEMLMLYDGAEFIRPDGSLDMMTNVERMGGIMMKELKNERMDGLRNEGVCELGKYWKQIQYINKWELRIYTHDYFSPITSTRVMRKTKNTYSIHYFAESWRDGKRVSGWHNWTITREIVNALVQVKRWLMNKG